MFSQIVSALGQFGLSQVRVEPIEGTGLIAVRITDFEFDHETTKMIANDIISPLGFGISSLASNCFYEGDDVKGAVVHVRAA
jgi:hypothetical protein